jgi:Fur family ferric uptake transcriptional regulator
MAMERSTRQRTAIAQALAAVGQPLLPQELLLEAQKTVPSLSLATVYRNLKGLVEDGVVDAVSLPGQATRYESHRHHHHHHFHCKSCHKVFDIDACPGDLGHLLPPGYRLEAHELTFYGRCAACAV